MSSGPSCAADRGGHSSLSAPMGRDRAFAISKSQRATLPVSVILAILLCACASRRTLDCHERALVGPAARDMRAAAAAAETNARRWAIADGAAIAGISAENRWEFR